MYDWRQQFDRLKPLLLFFAVFTGLFYLFAVTLKYTFPFIAGFLLALLAQPIIRLLKKALHLHGKPAAAISTLLVYILLFGLLFLLGYWLIYEVNHLINYITSLSKNGLASITNPINALIAQLNSYLKNIDSGFVKENQEKIIGLAQNGIGIATNVLKAVLLFLTSLPTIVTMLIVMIFSTYFFSKDMSKLKQYIKRLLPVSAAKSIRSCSRSGMDMSGKYICSYLLIYFITFLETLIVFTVLGIPFPLVLSIITGIADILPVLGPGTIYIPLALIYLIKADFFHAAILFICWLLITAIRQIIEPKLVSSSINIHPMIFLAALYFSLVAGNFWILIYFSVLTICYQILVKDGTLPHIFEEEKQDCAAQQQNNSKQK